jgi:hypothetical protein
MTGFTTQGWVSNAEEGNAIRLFKGAGGNVRYLGEFELDAESPYYRTDAPESGGGDLRQVIVFRLRPVGDVDHDQEDGLRLPSGVPSPELEAAVTGELSTALSVEVPVELQHTERAIVTPSEEPYEIERREQTLLLEFKALLQAQGRDATRLRIQPPGEARPLYCDLYDKMRNNLVEAKGSGTRGAVRMAIGQLADYARFIDPSPKRSVLVPQRPAS